MKTTRIVAFICTLLVLPLQAAAQAVEQHMCKESELSGSFNLITMTETPAGQELPWYQQYRFQYLVFHPDHTYNFVASQHRISTPDDLQKSIMKSIADESSPIAMRYTYDATGVLTLYINDRVDHTYRCMVLDKPYGPAPAGALELKGYSKQNTLLDKFFHRWP